MALRSFLILLLLAPLANPGSSLKLDRVWKRYRNPRWGFCVSYPARWVKGDAFDGAGIFVEAGLKKRSRPTGEINIAAEPGAFGLVQNVEVHLDGLKKFERAEQVELLEKREIQLLGSSALFAKDRYYDPLDHSRWMDELVFANHKQTLYKLELECPTDQVTRFEPVFTRLVSTFEFDCADDR
ncbi:MAG: hypothetical protein WB992_05105 [Bryobacteraceae bacterium]